MNERTEDLSQMDSQIQLEVGPECPVEMETENLPLQKKSNLREMLQKRNQNRMVVSMEQVRN